MLHKMRSMIEIEPEAARKEMIDAFVKAKCHYQDASDIIGCKPHTFTRWARLLGIKEKLEKLEAKAEKEGWHHGRKGGAGFHKNPELRVKRARRTRAASSRAAG